MDDYVTPSLSGLKPFGRGDKNAWDPSKRSVEHPEKVKAFTCIPTGKKYFKAMVTPPTPRKLIKSTIVDNKKLLFTSRF